MFNDEKTYTFTLYLKIWAMVFGPVGCLVAFFKGFSWYLVLTGLGAAVLAFFLLLFISWFGELAGNLFHGLGTTISSRQQLTAELDKARHLLRQERYLQARQVIDAVMEKEPEFAEALFIRAECEMRAGEKDLAETTLKEILRLCRETSPNRRWAHSLLKELRAAHEERPGELSGLP